MLTISPDGPTSSARSTVAYPGPQPTSRMRCPAPKPARRATKSGRVGGRAGVREPAVEDEVALDGDGVALLGRLKALRTSIAREERVPPYVVFPDRSLNAMAARRPRSLAMLSEIPGVGPARLDRYGDRFLELLRGG